MLNADLEKQKFLAACMGADPKVLEDLKYEMPQDGQPKKQDASLGEFEALGFGTNYRFKRKVN